MAQSFSEIKKTVADELEIFNTYYLKTLSSDKKIVQEAINYITKMQGKQLRPIMVLLTCGMHGEITEKAYVSSTAIELTHLASLIHDDIVDEAYSRRGNWSFNALWRSKKAVLIGDYVFSKAFRTATQHKLYDLLEDISAVIEKMSIGELQQSDATMRLDITEEEYFEVIQLKTAYLIGSCFYAGALSANADKEACNKIRNIGLEVGTIFQIKDDILDYCTDSTSGKIPCNDIKEKKITLPLICALNEATAKERADILSIIRHLRRKPRGVETILQFVKDKKGIEQAEVIMRNKAESIRIELQQYPQNRYRDTLINITEYICDRDK